MRNLVLDCARWLYNHKIQQINQAAEHFAKIMTPGEKEEISIWGRSGLYAHKLAMSKQTTEGLCAIWGLTLKVKGLDSGKKYQGEMEKKAALKA